jgi:monofunctional glycosyltransferase
LIFFIILGLHINLIIYIGISSLVLRFINPPSSSLMVYRAVFYNHKILPVKNIPLKNIPWYTKRMIVSAEDYRFYQHNGIDIEAIKTAMDNNKKIGFNYFGGSTITQQLARTLFLIPKKYMIRKYVEIIIALEMDLIIPKDRILELYMNYIEWGKGVFGIERASLVYFKKSSAYMSHDESARIITILPSPLNYNPDTFYNRPQMVYRYNFLSGLYN